jgi:hypothetical protein
VWQKIDEAEMDVEKSLIRPIGQKTNYLPSRDIAGRYQNTVVYGATAGFSRLEGDLRVQQMKGNGIISRDTAREQVPDFIPDPRAEGAKIDLEATQDALMQKLFQEAAPQDLQFLIQEQSKGKSLLQAMIDLQIHQQDQAAAQAPAGGPEGAPGAPEAGGADTGPVDQAVAAQKGAVPNGGPPGTYTAPPPPTAAVTIGTPIPGRGFNQTGGPS